MPPGKTEGLEMEHLKWRSGRGHLEHGGRGRGCGCSQPVSDRADGSLRAMRALRETTLPDQGLILWLLLGIHFRDI